MRKGGRERKREREEEGEREREREKGERGEDGGCKEGRQK